jgi:hypothetical protein
MNHVENTLTFNIAFAIYPTRAELLRLECSRLPWIAAAGASSGLPILGKRCSGDPLGRLRFIEGPHPDSNLTYVEAPDLATIACLQYRLNELDENVRIEIIGLS